jgi:hypothetical protein
MQKKLIALAVASLASGAAFAQTNVTMYGIADAGYVWSQGDALVTGTNKFSGIQSGLLSGSRLGFKGEEALGNGLKAIFTLEYGAEHRQQLRCRRYRRSERPPAVRRSGRWFWYGRSRPSVFTGLPGHGQQ